MHGERARRRRRLFRIVCARGAKGLRYGQEEEGEEELLTRDEAENQSPVGWRFKIVLWFITEERRSPYRTVHCNTSKAIDRVSAR